VITLQGSAAMCGNGLSRSSTFSSQRKADMRGQQRQRVMRGSAGRSHGRAGAVRCKRGKLSATIRRILQRMVHAHAAAVVATAAGRQRIVLAALRHGNGRGDEAKQQHQQRRGNTAPQPMQSTCPNAAHGNECTRMCSSACLGGAKIAHTVRPKHERTVPKTSANHLRQQ
jgi:hypothetical protein